MTTELSFLLDLLLSHKLPAATKTAVSERLKEVELHLNNRPPVMGQPSPNSSPMRINTGVAQAPSMQAIIDKYPDMAGQVAAAQVAIPLGAPQPAPVAHVTHVAQTPATAAAMASRQAALANAGKIEQGRTSPRKF